MIQLAIMMKPSPSRTYNPIHFEDLEPHRFEDMVRQLIYDFRDWADIQAVGRSGADKGVDIRAIEQVPLSAAYEPTDDEDDEVEAYPRTERRVWNFQCKRYNQMGPKKVVSVIDDDLNQQTEPPFAYVLVASCDFSHAAREAFRREMVERNIREFYLWGKAELEDRLYRPTHDHLLFAYFGISIQARKRSRKASLTANLSLKKKLVKALGNIRSTHYQHVLIRDPSDEAYPAIDPLPEDLRQLPWNYWRFDHHAARDGLMFELGAGLTYFDQETEQWDCVHDSIVFEGENQYLYPVSNSSVKLPPTWRRGRRFWSFLEKLIPEEKRARFLVYGRIPYERILLVDEIGDRYNEGPHILVDYLPGSSLITKTFGDQIYEHIDASKGYHKKYVAPLDEKQIKFFPDNILEQFSASSDDE